MKKPDISQDEDARLKTLRSLDILDTSEAFLEDEDSLIYENKKTLK